SRRRHTRLVSDWSSDVCSSDLKTTKTPTGRCRSSYTWRRRPSACRERHRRPLSIHPKARAESAYKLESCFKPGGNPTIQRNLELLLRTTLIDNIALRLYIHGVGSRIPRCVRDGVRGFRRGRSRRLACRCQAAGRLRAAPGAPACGYAQGLETRQYEGAAVRSFGWRMAG